ncbi:MAG: S4 domain-containing protein [Candidatus Micrarchaeia archaeon]
MSKKGGSGHIKRLAASSYIKINKKASKYVAHPNPGRYSMERSLALITFLKDKLSKMSAREAKTIISNGEIFINGKIIKEPKYPIGFGDIIFIKPEGAYYKITVGKRGIFAFEKVSKDEEKKNIYKVVGKYIAKGGKVMIRLHNGNIMECKDEVKVNDSVVINGDKLEKVLKFENGARCMVYIGIHAPETGKITNIKKGDMLSSESVEIKPDKNKSFETVAKNIIVVGA